MCTVWEREFDDDEYFRRRLAISRLHRIIANHRSMIAPWYWVKHFIQTVTIYDDQDKAQKIKHLISGRKSAWKRSLNDLRKIKRDYKSTLWPEMYLQDDKFLRKAKHIPDQKRRIQDAKRLTIEAIDDYGDFLDAVV